jgi:hypothetical protein
MANLFTDKTCHVCNNEMLPSAKNRVLVDGFYDQDTNQYVHWNCRDNHYIQKQQNGMAGLYSEMPAIL